MLKEGLAGPKVSEANSALSKKPLFFNPVQKTSSTVVPVAMTISVKLSSLLRLLEISSLKVRMPVLRTRHERFVTNHFALTSWMAHPYH